jgi:Abnormal spindle-like microcephaly-assoc'd, ASPM-SPD-2-Hydin
MTIAKGQTSSSIFWKKAGPLFLFAGLSLFTACAGVSNGPAHFTTTASGQLAVTPATLAFGSVLDGSTGTASGTLTASSASVTVSGVSSSNSLFTVGGLSLPVTIAAGQSVTFTVTFSPQTPGSVSGTLTFTSNAQPSTTVETLTGAGTSTTPANGQLAVTPATLALGNVVDGSSGTASGTLTASGGSVTVSAATSNNSVFSVGGLSLPATIPAGQSVPFSVTFSPQTPGAASGTLSFTSNGQPSTTIEILTGTGTPASTHTVALSWNASTSSNIVGYNLYRAVQSGSCGGFSKINTVLNTGTLYTDSAVVNGTTYCYAATAVDSSNAESSYSNIASNVQIPAI